MGNITFVSDANWNGSTSFGWNGYDGYDYANSTANVNITINAVNDLPTVSTITKSGAKNTAITFSSADFTTNFSDVEGDSLTKIKVTSLPSNGILNLSGIAITTNQEIVTGDLSDLTYDPNTNWTGDTSFTWKGYDGTAYSSDAANVDITISASGNNAPTVNTMSKSGSEDTTMTFSLADFTDQFTDSNGDSLTKVQIASLTNNGTLKLSGTAIVTNQEIASGNLANITFDPDTNWSGSAKFTWKGHDGVEYSTAAADANITIAAVNDAPVVSTITKSGTEDTTVTFSSADFTDKFSDVDGDSLGKIKIKSLPSSSHGALKLSGSAVVFNQEISVGDLANLTFEPVANWNGSTSFTWKGYDGSVYSDAAADVDITLSAVQDAPVVSDVTKTGTEDNIVIFSAADFSDQFTDADGDSLTKVKVISFPSNGVLKLAGTDVAVNQEIAVSDLGDLTFNPEANWYGSASFGWKGHDGTEYSSLAGDVNIHLSATEETAYGAGRPSAEESEESEETLEEWQWWAIGSSSVALIGTAVGVTIGLIIKFRSLWMRCRTLGPQDYFINSRNVIIV